LILRSKTWSAQITVIVIESCRLICGDWKVSEADHNTRLCLIDILKAQKITNKLQLSFTLIWISFHSEMLSKMEIKVWWVGFCFRKIHKLILQNSPLNALNNSNNFMQISNRSHFSFNFISLKPFPPSFLLLFLPY
jgi:hypothetical protein